jgi:hypothetical protein
MGIHISNMKIFKLIIRQDKADITKLIPAIDIYNINFNIDFLKTYVTKNEERNNIMNEILEGDVSGYVKSFDSIFASMAKHMKPRRHREPTITQI